MPEEFICNWSGCDVQKKREIIWHVIVDHLEEARVPYNCSLCHFRAANLKILNKHTKTYQKHTQMVRDGEDETNCLVVSDNPYYVNIGIDTSICDAILRGWQIRLIQNQRLKSWKNIQSLIQVYQSVQKQRVRLMKNSSPTKR